MNPLVTEALSSPPLRQILEIWIALLGAVVGSFLNVCIYRMPRDKSLVRPRSACPGCDAPIAWHDNIPLLSFLFLRGRCRRCKTAISLRYPMIEALTAFLFWASFRTWGWSPQTLVALPLCAALVVVSFIDLDFQIIPNRITYPGIALGLLFSFAWPSIHQRAFEELMRWGGLKRSLIGAGAGYGILAVVGIASYLVYKKEAMGRGDFKLLAMLGTVLGWRGVLWTLFLACVVGSVIGMGLILSKKKDRKDYIPFGPFLAGAGLLVFFFDGFFERVWVDYFSAFSGEGLS